MATALCKRLVGALAAGLMACTAPAQAGDVLTVTPGAPPPSASWLYNPEAIGEFLVRLPPVRGEKLTVLQIGDSHTAGDMFTNGWRSEWQARFGAGGRGILPVGKPYAGYITWGVTASQSSEWDVNAMFGKRYTPGRVALGTSGFTQTASKAGAWLGLKSDSDAFRFDEFSLCGVTGPQMGSVSVLFGAQMQVFDFAATSPGATCFETRAPVPVDEVVVTTLDDRQVSLTSWDTRRSNGGLVISNLGVVGASLQHFSRIEDDVLAAELHNVKPDMIVLAFGTNEGFTADLDVGAAEMVLRSQVGRLRRLLGYPVPILLIGPPDSASSRGSVARLDLAETADCGAGWYVPGNLARIKAMQRRVAGELGLAFWDWQGAMGGTCSSSRWVAENLMRGDHVHFTAEGGRRLGQALAIDLANARARLTSN